MWMYLLCAAMGIVILVLLLKILTMKRSAREICEKFSASVEQDTNTLIDIGSHDGDMRRLAGRMNEELRVFHRERRRFCEGDRELKEAIANISHDLRTPLTAICGYLDLLKAEEKSEAAKRYVEIIENRTRLMKKLTEELFRYSVLVSVEEGETEMVSLNQVLEESLAASYSAMKAKQMIPEIVMPETRVERRLDRSALVRVFGNVISNAVKYSDGDFKAELKESGEIIFSNSAGSLTPVMAARLFDRFYTVETGRNSTGLGLSIAKILTERMGGTIRAEYIDGKLYIIIKFPAENA